MERMKAIKITISEEEKTIVEKLAAQKKIPVATYVKELVREQFPKEEVAEKDLSHAFVEEQELDAKDRAIKFYVSETEYEKLKDIAGPMPLSKYVRETLANATGGRYILEIKTDDLDELNEAISEINMHVDGFIGALRFRSDIFPADIERLEGLIRETNELVSNLSKEIYNNRENIRKEGKREIRNRIKNIIH